MAKFIEKKTSYEEDEIRVYKSSLPQVGDTIVICGDVAPSYGTGSKGGKWIRCIPVLINGQARALSLSSFNAVACEGANCYPQNECEATSVVNSGDCWDEIKQLGGTTMKVVKHFPLVCWGSAKRATYRWTAIGCEWSDTPDHTFTEAEKTALAEAIAKDQARA